MQYIADKIDSGSAMPAKPVITPEMLQEVHYLFIAEWAVR